jgi:hypothetical protein
LVFGFCLVVVVVVEAFFQHLIVACAFLLVVDLKVKKQYWIDFVVWFWIFFQVEVQNIAEM